MIEERWGDFRDWKDWRQRNASLIAQEICEHNQGHYPATLAEWQETAARYGLTLRIVDKGVSTPATRQDNSIFVRDTSRPNVLNRRIVHEIAEAIALREGELRQFNFVSNADEHHNVARLVEKDIQSQIRAEVQATSQTRQALEQKRQQMESKMRRLLAAIAEQEARERELELQLD